MARKKVKLAYITHNKTRLDTLKKRTKSLMKKAGEVSIMCNTKASVIVYPEGESLPQVFSSHDEMLAMLSRCSIMSDDDPFNKKMDHECFLEKSLRKLQKHVIQSKRHCDENEMKLLLHKAMLVGHGGLSMEELTEVDRKVELLRKSISDRITKICGQPPVYLPSQAHVVTTNTADNTNTIGDPTAFQANKPTLYHIGSMGVVGAPMMYKDQVPTSYVTGGMDTMGAPAVYQHHAPTPYSTGMMDTIGSPVVNQTRASPHQHDKWLEWMRTGGGDLDGTVRSDFNGGSTHNSNAGLNGNATMQPLHLGACLGFPWRGVDPGPSSSAFPPM